MGKTKFVIVLVILDVFICSGFLLIRDRYERIDDLKEVSELSDHYTTTIDQSKEVDFDALLKRNKDVIGWIYIPDTKVDEPVLKGKDNNTYLRTNIDGKSKTSGSIFVDEINSKDFSDIQTIIYGHNLHNGSKFALLKDYQDEDYLNKHNTIYLYTPSASYTYTVVAASIIRKNSYMYANEIKVTDLIINADICHLKDTDKIKHCIMLSTCYDTGSSDRYVIWAIRNE